MSPTLSSSDRFQVTAATLVAMAAIVAGIAYALQGTEKSAPEGPVEPAVASVEKFREPAPQYFPGLPPPSLVLMLSGQTHGYLQPCGCSRPQIGGLERRYELLKELRAKGWSVSPSDLGDAAPKVIDEQGRLKFETIVQVLHDMSTAALGVGFTEMSMPLDQALANALNYQPPHVLAANFNDGGQYPGMFKGWTISEPRPGEAETAWIGQVAGNLTGVFLPPLPAFRMPPSRYLRVAYIGMVAESVAKQSKERDANLNFDPIDKVMPDVLKQVQAQRPDILVLLLQGSPEEGKKVAEKYPQFHVVQTLEEYNEPSSLAKQVGTTLLISMGNKGKHVGLVGVAPKSGGDQTKPAFDLHYQLVHLTEHFELPDTETNLARERMKDYVQRIHDGEFLTRYPRRSHTMQLDHPQATYVGSEKCKDCHKSAYEKWAGSKHSEAYENLVKYGRPRIILGSNEKGGPSTIIGRQFDPDCIKCHTTGFEYKGGFVTEKATPHLKGNGCENCHGPASLHVATAKNALMADTRYSRPLHLSIGTVEKTCRNCHDEDNDPKFDLPSYWEKIRHGR